MAEIDEKNDLAVHHAGLRNGRFLVPNCHDCERSWWPPRAVCPRCQSTAFTWTDLPPSMRIFSWTVVHRTPLKEFEELTPYAVAILESDDAEIQVIGRIAGSPDGIEINDACAFEITTGPMGDLVPLWFPTGDR